MRKWPFAPLIIVVLLQSCSSNPTGSASSCGDILPIRGTDVAITPGTLVGEWVVTSYRLIALDTTLTIDLMCDPRYKWQFTYFFTATDSVLLQYFDIIDNTDGVTAAPFTLSGDTIRLPHPDVGIDFYLATIRGSSILLVGRGTYPFPIDDEGVRPTELRVVAHHP